MIAEILSAMQTSNFLASHRETRSRQQHYIPGTFDEHRTLSIANRYFLVKAMRPETSKRKVKIQRQS